MRKEQKRNIKYLKREEWQKLKASIDNVRDKLIIGLLYSTGMRVGELALVRTENIDFEEGFIWIPWENTKTKTARTVYVPGETVNDIKAYLRLTRRKERLLFGLTKRRIQQLVKKYSERSGVVCSAHTLRHTHVVHALMDKVPIAAVQKQVGHKRLTTTQIYSDLAPEQVKEAYERREK
ncbi:MAG: tyrosine-type recombinase/integrase [Clostridia bacterium]|jgi:integrase|nr:tyrosine-type recombinase/integrase [Clostridia bacterium]